MKKALLLVTISLSCLLSLAQQKQTEAQQKSKIELFSDKSGSLVKKEIIDIGLLNSIKFQVEKLTDVSVNTTISGLRLEGPSTSSYSKRDFIAFLDSDEIESFAKAIEYLIGASNKPVPDNYVEYNFTSRSGFRAGSFKSKDKWDVYIQIDKYDSNSEYFLTANELSNIKDLLTQVKAKL